MPATYTYRSGAAPTAVDALTEITREIGTAAAQRIQGNAFSSIPELSITPAFTIDTNADEYTAIFVLDGNAISPTRQEYPWGGYGSLGSGATIAPVPLYQEPLQIDNNEVRSTGKLDVATDFVQHGDTVALGFCAVGLTVV